MPCTVIVPVQAVLVIELLTIILIRLHIVRCREHPAERIIMIRLLNSSRGTDDHTAITLVVLQVIMVLAVSQGDIALFRQQVFLRAVFIDHIAAIVSRGGRTSCFMHRAQLCAVSCIQISYRIPVPERDLAWQI